MIQQISPEQYMTDRVDEQIRFYEDRSQLNQRWFRRLRITEIIAAATIPFLAGYIDYSLSIQVLVGFLGVVIAVLAGIMTLYQFQENWSSYRSTCETLRHEKILFNTRSAPYDTEGSFPLFVQRIEAILMGDHEQWRRRMQSTLQEDEVGNLKPDQPQDFRPQEHP